MGRKRGLGVGNGAALRAGLFRTCHDGGRVKTTVEIADSLFAEATAYAEAHGLSFRELVEESLRSTLQEKRRSAKRFCLRAGSFRGEGLQANLSWPEIRRQIYEGRGE